MITDRVLVIGDIHEGKKHRVTYGDPKIWDKASLEILQLVLEKEEPSIVILAGDLFDNSNPSAMDLVRLASCFDPSVLVIPLAGNHDIPKVTGEQLFYDLDTALQWEPVNYNDYKIKVLNGAHFGFIAWHETQQYFEQQMEALLRRLPEGSVVVAHCNRKYWENDNDNAFTDELYDLAAAKDILVLSGHEHKASVSPNFIHLGSIVPHAINQVGPRYYWIDGELKELPQHEKVHLLTEEPMIMNSDSCYYIKPQKEVTVDDLKLEAKDLTVDVIASFIEAAIKEGFEKEFIDEFIEN